MCVYVHVYCVVYTVYVKQLANRIASFGSEVFNKKCSVKCKCHLVVLTTHVCSKSWIS